jgi:hypothetical protein
VESRYIKLRWVGSGVAAAAAERLRKWKKGRHFLQCQLYACAFGME